MPPIVTTRIQKPMIWNNGSVLNIETNVGWNQQPNRLTLSIVDTPDRDFEGDTPLALRDITEPEHAGYILPEVGSFQSFNLSGVLTGQGLSGISTPFKFEGIVMSHDDPKITESANIKQTVLHDTREVLNNIPVIISSSCRDVKLPTSVNAFSWYDVWWPSIGTLNISNINEFGMSWETIRDAINGRPIGTQDLTNAKLPTFAEISPNYAADGFYVDGLVSSYVSYRDMDSNAKFSYQKKPNDSSLPDVNSRIKETLPPSDWIQGGASGVPTSHQDGTIKFSQSIDRVNVLTVRNVGKGSGQIIHMDTGFVVNMTTTTASGIQNPAIFDYFGGHYKINLDKVPIQDINFRIRGDTIYLGELLDQVSTFGQFDWFVKETLTDDEGIHEIIIDTVDRRKKVEFDEQLINDWVDSLKNGNESKVIKYDQSRELRNEPTSMVLLGGRIEQLTRKQIGGQWYGIKKHSVPLEQQTISLIGGNIGQIKDRCQIDFGHLNLPFLSDTYNFDEITLRCAMYDPEPFGSLFNYLCHIYHPIIADLERGLGVAKPGMGINFIGGSVNGLYTGVQQPFIKNYRAADTDSVSMRNVLQGITNYGDMAINILEAIGHTIESFAFEYWGRQFVIKHPSSLLTNWDITSSAYQGFSYNEATAFFRENEGVKVHGFVVYNKINPMFFRTSLSDKEILLTRNTELVVTPQDYVKFVTYQAGDSYDLYVAATFEVMDNRFLVAKISSPVFWNMDESIYGGQVALLGQYVNRSAFSSRTQQAFFGTYGAGMSNSVIYPTYAFIPLVSKNDRYGPWLSEGIVLDTTQDDTDENGVAITRSRGRYRITKGYDGRLEIITDDELTPWVLGGTPTEPFLGMNRAANARVANAASNLTKPISATVIVEGFPEKNIADSLEQGTGLTGGNNANISDISISFGEDKISTTYIVRNFAAKQREYKTQDFKMGAALSINSTNFRSYITNIGAKTYGRLPSKIWGNITRGGNKMMAQGNRKQAGLKETEEPNNIKAGFVGANYAHSVMTTPGQLMKIKDENWSQVGYGTMAAFELVSRIGASLAASGVAGTSIEGLAILNASLR